MAHHNIDLWRCGDARRRRARWACGRDGRRGLRRTFEHYAFSGDEGFLRKAYPTLKEASQFLLDFLVEDEKGRLVTNSSHSPENAFVDEKGKGQEGVLAWARPWTSASSVSSSATRSRPPSSARTRSSPGACARPRPAAAPHQIAPRPAQEWLVDFDEAEPGHRHMSHLFALHPGYFDQAARHARSREGRSRRSTGASRTAEGTGWSRAWIVNHFARLGDGDEALRHLT
ncbi:MAG: hypothetical protein U0599_16860 [Vicinamibacteria bacterium]